MENTTAKTRYLWVECSVCGNRWRSHGKGKRLKCPKCYEERTGKKYGQSPEQMAAIRAMRKPKQTEEIPAEPETVIEPMDPMEPIEPAQNQTKISEPKQENALEKFLGFRLS